MLLLMALSPIAFAGDVLINEVLYNPDGTDGGSEWIEFCNAGTDTVDLSGWMIEVTGTSSGSGVWKESYTFDVESIAPGEYLYLGPYFDTGMDDPDFSPDLPNGGSYTSGIRLVQGDGSTVEDTLLYGDSTNTYGFTDDAGATDKGAGDSGSGFTLYRWPDCTDTNESSVDFGASGDPTPGDANTEYVGGGDDGGDDGSGGACTGGSGMVLINEFVADPAGTDSGNEWVEIYNADTDAIDLTGWTLKAGTSSLTTQAELSGTIEPGQYMVVGGDGVAFADFVDSGFSLGNATSNSDAIQLHGCEGYTDTVVYGEDNSADLWTEDDGSEATSMAPKTTSGLSIGRWPDGVDTDVSGTDFATLDWSSPGEPNDVEPTCEGSEFITINEFMADPEGSDDGLEWVELYNSGSDAVDLSGWTVRKATSASSTSDFVLPDGTSVEAGGFLLVGGSLVADADVVFGDDEDESELSLGNASSGADAVMLLHCGGVVSDTVIYGTSNEEEQFSDDTGEVVDTELAPKPSSGLSLARCGDGTDSNDSSTDWWTPDTATPGETNGECTPPICEGGALDVKINELLYNPAGSDTDYEWIELYNTGDSDLRIDQWMLQTGTSEWKDTLEFPGGTTIEAGGFLLIGDAAVPAEARDIEANLSLGNAGGAAPDGARLVDCEGTLQDTVLWGDVDSLEDDLFDDVGEQTMVPVGEDGMSAGRFPDGADSDDNSVDFLSVMPQTPGRANEEPSGGDDGGGTGGVSKGCSKSNDDADGPPSKGCTVASPVGAWAWLLGGVVLIRRRRR